MHIRRCLVLFTYQGLYLKLVLLLLNTLENRYYLYMNSKYRHKAIGLSDKLQTTEHH